MNPQIEFRGFGEKIELREVKKDGFLDRGLRGYAVVYGRESRDMGGWKEIIARGAFTESLKNMPDVRMLYQHDTKQIMARAAAGTLLIREDTQGVYFEADLIDTPTNREALSNIRSGNIDAMSFGMPFGSVTAKWERSADKKYDVRTVTRAALVEISPVTWAAYEDTSVAAREHTNFLSTVQDATTPVETLRNRLELAKRKYRN